MALKSLVALVGRGKPPVSATAENPDAKGLAAIHHSVTQWLFVPFSSTLRRPRTLVVLDEAHEALPKAAQAEQGKLSRC